MTRRMIRAIEHPAVTFVGHMSGRLLLQREPYSFDMNKVLDAIARNGKWIEINASPVRLDLDWRVCHQIRDRGIQFCINPDAHSTGELSSNRYGLDVARKAGLTRENIANTQPLKTFLELLGKTRGNGTKG
jgi:DNA polymerase (family 10)